MWRYLVFLLFFVNTCFATNHDLYPFPNSAQAEQFQGLLKELRCLVCQNQDLADSNAKLANDLRAEVYQAVRAGKSDREIIEFLTARYGDFVLFNPPFNTSTYLLWLIPFVAFVLGITLMSLIIYRRSCASPGDSDVMV